MKRHLAIIGALFAAASLAGCITAADVNTATSRKTLYGVVNGYGAALSAENTYKELCVSGVIAGNCRANVVKLQAADRKAVAAISAANDFIKTYPTVDAGNIIAAAQSAVADFQTVINSTGAH